MLMKGRKNHLVFIGFKVLFRKLAITSGDMFLVYHGGIYSGKVHGH